MTDKPREICRDCGAVVARPFARVDRNLEGYWERAYWNIVPKLQEALATQPVRKLSYEVPIDVAEERLNNLSDLAIGEAQGGELGRAMVDQARRNLAVLDEIDAAERMGRA